ncbi:sensor histidine kinase [Actinomycetospora straminea]|uniref:histidine kinase n=1 Tax=Actinomycetospora straminea TaxID=663607 RepID=A0ABP9ESQ9_9PSEU|nr:HAMP domain-containing sensor histidine kinase [Actinomycetospora straminea]MDD7931485.1 HAMP domain-containing sensor histidine kinase [Actinomycetospora straminea]
MSTAPTASPVPRRGPGLRLRLTLLATGLVAVVAVLLVWLGWVLVGQVVAAVPQLPPDTPVMVDGVRVPAGELADALGRAARVEVLRIGALAFAMVVVAAALISWVTVRRVLRPLHDVTATAQRLSAESLDARIGLTGPRDEVAELAATFDAMLDRLQAAFDAQQRFVANASHELRTPLAVLRTEVDVTLADPDADAAELRRMGEVIRDATRRAEDLVAGLLFLARTEAADAVPRDPVDLAETVPGALDAVRAEARDRNLTVHTELAPAGVAGDAALLGRVAGNLLENAVRHNVEGGWLAVRTRVDDGHAVLSVSSSGPVVAPAMVAELFEPFRRGAGRTGSGTGLGLSIVRAVARAHGGRAVAEPVAGGGLTVDVVLPRAQDS